MIGKEEMEQVLQFVSKRWTDISRDPENKAMNTLPTDFWMNSVGGKAGNGRWLTMLMYTENEEDANSLKEVLLRWQAKGMQKNPASDLIQLKKG
ncbi:MAG: hypothetical protein O6746_01800 [Thaumarchaeota archaeon]|jgi:hypothetical protein|nr:MAG: hypothetical protein NPMRd3_390005 [Nitrosopumilales archaeon]MCZ6583627.1 hypothetical protein [Nitrososphaerota archaeon]